MGKVRDWVTANHEALEPKDFWSPDFQVMINKSDQEGPMGVKPTVLLCEVLDGGEISWNDEGLKVAALESPHLANAQVAKFRKARR